VRLSRIGLIWLWLPWIAACGQSGPPPYGFDQKPEQAFVFEAEETSEIDGVSVKVTRYSEFDLLLGSDDPGRTELNLRLGRYYMKVEGAPGGRAELALSSQGMVSQSPTDGEVRIGPDDPMPGGRTVRALLRAPVAGVVLAADGRMLGDPWRSQEPILQDLPLIEWVALALPVLGGPEGGSWNGRRPLPPLGQYRLGMELSVRYEWSRDDGGTVIRSASGIERASVELARGFRGSLQIESRGEASLADGFVEIAHVDLRALFRAEDDSEVRSSYRVRLRCSDCDQPTINPPTEGSDRPGG
jgi:hypothetical protein